MGRALARHPQAFLLDEPLSNLDAKLRTQLRAELKRIHQLVPTTSIYVTHDQVEAMTLGHRIAVMAGGRIQQLGDPQDVYDRPANLFVAGFIGSPGMNLLPGTLRRDATAATLEIQGDRLALPASVGGRDGDQVVFGVRPEHLALTDAADSVHVAVKVVEQTGIDSLVFADFAGHELCALFRDRQSLAPGQPIRLRPQPESIHLFDARSGARLAA